MTDHDSRIDEPDLDDLFDEVPLCDEYLDTDFLEEALDRIFDSDQFLTPQKTTLKFSSLTRQEKEILISKMCRETCWGGLSTNNFEMDRTPRGNICLSCRSVNCTHVVQFASRLNIDELLENAMRSCSHQSDDEIFDEVCAKCIIESCENASELNNNTDSSNIRLLWDEQDLIEYYTYIDKINPKFKWDN